MERIWIILESSTRYALAHQTKSVRRDWSAIDNGSGRPQHRKQMGKSPYDPRLTGMVALRSTYVGGDQSMSLPDIFSN
ncbi:hypothetical protein OS493_016937 [Desmophyllum pertusum]|uniref:Uncharacterized protein n=1 Tax=Desmophyllum pertusum TaxID=174260 RepID=A0A9W9YNQ7_9CNID|nr:hypothetical protein OS493_016937 [Desmophyllum pertusum]